MNNLATQMLIAFVAMFALDFVWVYYTKAVVEKRPWFAGQWAGAITILNGVAAVIYVGDPWTIIPAGAGAAVGTVIAMKTNAKA